MDEFSPRQMSVCAICGKSVEREPIALISIQSASGVGSPLAAHRECVLNILHPDSRATLAK